MGLLWKCIEKRNMKQRNSNLLFLFMNILMWSFFGLLVWLLFRCFGLDSVSYMICFAGYPGYFVGFIGGILFLWNKTS